MTPLVSPAPSIDGSVPRISSRLPLWTRSLRFRLTAWYVGLLALILITSGFLLYNAVRYVLVEETDSFLRLEAGHLLAVMEEGAQEKPDREDMRQAVNAQPINTIAFPSERNPTLHSRKRLLTFDVVYLRYVNRSSGRTAPAQEIVASSGLERNPDLTTALDTLIPQNLRISFPEGRFAYAGPDEERMMRVLTVPVAKHRQTLYAQAAVPWDHNADLLEQLSAILWFAVPAILVPVSFGGWALVGRTLHPIRRIASEAERFDTPTAPKAFLMETTETDSEIGELVATLNRMTARLHDAFDSQRRFAQVQQQFAADASHELRTPLTILRGEIELALSRERTPERYRATLSSSLEEIARLSRIVEGLGLLSRQDSAEASLRSDGGPVNLREIGDVVRSEMQVLADKKQQILNYTRDAVLPVRGNPDQLYLLLKNLVENAIKFTDVQGVITIEATSSSEWVVITVRDTGVGIAEQDIGFVFDRFWRADRSRNTPGTGLGLAIAKQIAEAHGGDLSVTSQVGVGSCFRLRLPRSDETA